MSEFLAEAQVLIRPNTAAFRARLLLELREIQASVPAVRIPVIAGGAAGAASVAAANKEVAVSNAAMEAAAKGAAVSERELAAAEVSATAAATNQARALELSAASATRLANAERVAALKIGELAQARTVLSERTAAVALAEKAHAAAIKTGDAGLAAATGLTFGLARARQTEAEAAVASTLANRALAVEQAKAGKVVAAQQARTLASASNIARAQELGVATATRLAGVEAATALTSTDLAAARARLAQLNIAAGAAERALGAALSAGNIALIDAASNTAVLVRARQAEAAAAVEAAIAESRLAATQAQVAKQQAFVARGGFATALSMLGVRGATLAANSAFLVGAGAAVGFFKSLQLAIGLEKQLSVFRVTADATADEMERMSETARSLGRDITLPGVTAIDASQSMLEFAKAGLSVDDSITGARGALQLATAAQIDYVSSTQLVANALNAFSLEGAEAVRVADLLTGAANESQASIADMGLALKQSAAVANLAGISVEDTVTILTQLAQAGLSGSDAGTSFRTSLIRLIRPIGQTKEALKTLNVELRDSEGNIRPEVFAEIGEELERLTPAARQTTIAMLGGADAIRAFGILAEQGAKGFRDTGKAVQEPGLAAEQAAAQMVGLGGSTENLKNQMTEMGINIGNLAKGPLKALVDGLALDVRALNAAAQATSDFGNRIRDFGDSLPGGNKGLIDYTKSVGIYLDKTTAGIPVVRGFFDTLDKGSGTAETTAAVFDRLTTSVTGTLDALARGFQAAAGAAAAAAIPATLGNTLARDIAVAQAEGNQNRELELLRQKEANQNIFLQGVLKRPETKANVKLAEDAARNLESTRSQIQSILDGRTSDAERAKSDIIAATRDAEQAQRDADQALIASFDPAQTKARNAILAAASTEQLSDDIKGQIALRTVITKQIAVGRDKISDRKDLAAFLNEQNKELFQINLTIAELRDKAVLADVSKRVGAAERKVENAELTESLNDDIRAQINLRKTVTQAIARLQAEGAGSIAAIKDFIEKRKAIKQKIADLRQEQRTERLEGLGLNVEFAEITGNRSAEVKAREAEIKAIREQMNHEKKTSNEYKRLRNLLATKQKELNELKGEKDKANNAFNELTFDFLQKQQGFAANLLGNLIPGSATGGLVGASQAATPTPASGLQAQAAFKTASPTYGQMATEVDVLKQVLQVLREIQRGRAHPEAALQRAQVNSTMDFQGGV